MSRIYFFLSSWSEEEGTLEVRTAYSRCLSIISTFKLYDDSDGIQLRFYAENVRRACIRMERNIPVTVACRGPEKRMKAQANGKPYSIEMLRRIVIAKRVHRCNRDVRRGRFPLRFFAFAQRAVSEWSARCPILSSSAKSPDTSLFQQAWSDGRHSILIILTRGTLAPERKKTYVIFEKYIC